MTTPDVFDDMVFSVPYEIRAGQFSLYIPSGSRHPKSTLADRLFPLPMGSNTIQISWDGESDIFVEIRRGSMSAGDASRIVTLTPPGGGMPGMLVFELPTGTPTQIGLVARSLPTNDDVAKFRSATIKVMNIPTFAAT